MNGGKHHELQPKKQQIMFIVSTSKEHAFMECFIDFRFTCNCGTLIYICYEV
jgi:hypothetical protein